MPYDAERLIHARNRFLNRSSSQLSALLPSEGYAHGVRLGVVHKLVSMICFDLPVRFL